MHVELRYYFDLWMLEHGDHCPQCKATFGPGFYEQREKWCDVAKEKYESIKQDELTKKGG